MAKATFTEGMHGTHQAASELGSSAKIVNGFAARTGSSGLIPATHQCD